ncbi:MAG: FAD-binding oxidoreductase [Pseudomonadota bacterium]
MNLLDANDAAGTYPPSWYADRTPPLPRFSSLEGERRADVCVVGAGYTGLHAALRLAASGLDVALVEAQRVGFGASGRNGGQVGSGQRQDQAWLEDHFGKTVAHQLWDIAESAKALTRSTAAKLTVDCEITPGIAHACSSKKSAEAEHRYAEKLKTDYGYSELDCLGCDDFRAVVLSKRYHGGTIDRGAFHLNPLAYVLGLARHAADSGVQIYENTRAVEIGPGSVLCDRGRVRAENIIIAANGYLGKLENKTAAHVLPINSFVIATEPLGVRGKQILAKPIAVADDKFVVNYFRQAADSRLLFGGGENYGYRFPRNIARRVRPSLEAVFPQLANVHITHAWGGTLAVTRTRLPYLGRSQDGVWSAGGFSGHGVAMAGLAGHAIAEAILGEGRTFDVFERIQPPPFPGGPLSRHPLLVAAMLWFALRDRLSI